jgi:hypothetical protein
VEEIDPSLPTLPDLQTRRGVRVNKISRFHALTRVLSVMDASPIESVEICGVFELYWKRYAAYLVTGELIGSNARTEYDDECYTGRLLRVYSKSHFLDHGARDTGGHLDSLQHYKLVCLNHLIDVAAYAPPDVRVRAPQAQVRPLLKK